MIKTTDKKLIYTGTIKQFKEYLKELKKTNSEDIKINTLLLVHVK